MQCLNKIRFVYLTQRPKPRRYIIYTSYGEQILLLSMLFCFITIDFKARKVISVDADTRLIFFISFRNNIAIQQIFSFNVENSFCSLSSFQEQCKIFDKSERKNLKQKVDFVKNLFYLSSLKKKCLILKFQIHNFEELEFYSFLIQQFKSSYR